MIITCNIVIILIILTMITITMIIHVTTAVLTLVSVKLSCVYAISGVSYDVVSNEL